MSSCPTLTGDKEKTMDPGSVFSLEGKVAFVSGGAGAIGSAIAEALGAAGARVAVGDKTAERAQAVADKIATSGIEVIAAPGDATNEAEAAHAVEVILSRFGRLDIIVNAVGGGAGKVIFGAEEYPRDAWDWIMELNLRSTLVATQAAVKPMIAAGRGGRVLNISSVRAQLGISTGYSAYVAAKGAVSALTRQWATEWAKHGINVNAIAPTFVDTPQVAMLLGDPDFRASVVSRVPLGRVGVTGDLVGPAIFFTSDASAFVTGQVLTIDGGLTATQ
jgi:NAD(P)-dependent dehydrogenase (short-subunit alcohol dehydrogenase family)